MSTDRPRETDALVEENNAIAHELEVYGFRLTAALLRRNATTIDRQGKALRAVYDLCFQREQMTAGEPNPAFAAQLTTAEIRDIFGWNKER